MLKVRKHITWKFPSGPDWSGVINNIADVLVVDIKGGVRDRKDINDGGFAPLNKKTIEQKSKKGYANPSTPLLATQRMVGAGGGFGGATKGIQGGTGVWVKKKATPSRQIAVISVAENRKDITVYHNEGTGHIPARTWFGVGSRATRKLTMAADNAIRKAFKA